MIESFLNSVVGNSSFPILIFATLISSIAFFPILMPLFSKKRDYKGKHVFISGGSTGIGLSLAHEFLLLGANVTLVARTQLKLEKAVEELQDLARARNLPGRVQAFSADVTAYSEVRNSKAKEVGGYLGV
jgi:3-dehydrosphinganine reductase